MCKTWWRQSYGMDMFGCQRSRLTCYSNNCYKKWPNIYSTETDLKFKLTHWLIHSVRLYEDVQSGQKEGNVFFDLLVLQPWRWCSCWENMKREWIIQGLPGCSMKKSSVYEHIYIKAYEYLQLKHTHTQNLAHSVASCKAVQECVTFIYSPKTSVSGMTKFHRKTILFWTKSQQLKTTQSCAMLSFYQEKSKLAGCKQV